MPEHEERDKTTPEERHEQKQLAEELKGKEGVRNPYALSWWLAQRKHKEK